LPIMLVSAHIIIQSLRAIHFPRLFPLQTLSFCEFPIEFHSPSIIIIQSGK